MKDHEVVDTISLTSSGNASLLREDDEIDLMELLSVLLTNLRWIIAAIILFAVGAFLFTQYMIVPKYRSTGSIYVVSSKDSVISLSDFQMGNYLASDYEEVVYTWEVLQQTRQNLSLDYSHKQLRSMIYVNNPLNTRILEITVESTSPDEAALIANELINVVSNYVVNVMETEKPNTLSQARSPIYRYSPSMTKNVILGALLGGFISVLVIFVLFIVDDKIRTPDDILKHTDMYTLAIVPRPVNTAPYTSRKKRKGLKNQKAN